MSRGVSIKSPNASVFVQNGESFSESNLDLGLYKLVQNFSYSVSLPRQESKQIGSQDLSFRELVQQPDVQLNFTYIPEPSFGNEASGNFTESPLLSYKNMFSGVLDQSTNFYVVTTPETGNTDAFDSVTFDGNLFNLTGFDCMAFGNCFPTSYSLSYGIGTLPSVSTSYICSNVVFEHLTGTSMEMPSINLTGGNNNNVGRCLFKIDSQTTRDRNPPIINPTNPQSSVTLQNLQVGGQRLSGIHFIQAVDMQVSLSRVSSYGLGNDFAYNRKAQLPAQGTFSVSSLVSGFDEGFVTGVLSNDRKYDFELVLASGDKKMIYEIQEAKLDSYNYGMPINDKMTFDASFSFTVTEEKGLRFSGSTY
jgi:hypothetical protein